jgi:asparagine synthase (glutamine-hydrolysing)
MSAFLLAVALDRASMPCVTTELHASLRGRQWLTRTYDQCAFATSRPDLRAEILRADGSTLVAIGMVRLDHRRDLLTRFKHVAGSGTDVSDIGLVARIYDADQTVDLTALAGDYAYALWDSRTSQLRAVRDVVGVGTLYYRSTRGAVVLGSHASLVATATSFDVSYLRAILTNEIADFTTSAFAGVSPLRRACVATWNNGHIVERRYWSPPSIVRLTRPGDRDDLVDHFRQLLFESVRTYLDRPVPVWSTLSGGLDSSSLVMCASELRRTERTPRRVEGTVSVVDEIRSASDGDFIDAVVNAAGVRNYQIWNFGLWDRDGEPLPKTDRPELAYPFYARDRALSHAICDASDVELWIGSGPDNLLSSRPDMLANLLASGNVADVAGQSLALAVRQKKSIWKLLYRQAILPTIFPQKYAAYRGTRPKWLRDRSVNSVQSGRHGRMAYRETTHIREGELDVVSWNVSRPYPYRDGVVVRYPYLHRPLFEFSCALPLPLRHWNGQKKVILREAVAGVLPEVIRSRKGKATIGPRVIASLIEQRAVVLCLLRDSIVADLGLIEPKLLRRAIARVDVDGHGYDDVLDVLSLETWLRVHTDTWRDPRDRIDAGAHHTSEELSRTTGPNKSNGHFASTH